ncbi:MAG: RDD family protein [Anaerolineae bacterium]|jgi:uncharacterized RDD family membrane protein YckC
MTVAGRSIDWSKKEVTVVGFGPRLLAAMVDSLIVGFFGFMIALVVGMIGIFVGMFRPEQSSGPLEALIVGSALLFSIFYYVGFWSTDGQSVGKTLLGLKVVSTDGSQLSVGKALLRYLGYIINALLLSVGFMWAAFDRMRQGWHDKIAGTLVVYVDDDFGAEDKVGFVASDQESKGWMWAALWVVAVLLLPIGGLAGLVAVGPFVTISVTKLLQNLF